MCFYHDTLGDFLGFKKELCFWIFWNFLRYYRILWSFTKVMNFYKNIQTIYEFLLDILKN